MNRRQAAAASALVLAFVMPLPLAAAGSAVAAPATSVVAAAPATPAAAAAAAERQGVQITLPRPTGRHAVGQDTLHLVDRSRTDPWARTGPRELMVTLRYPAQRGTGSTASYLSDEEARGMLAPGKLERFISVETLSGTTTHSRERARPVPGRFPLVILSPGFTVHRATLTSLAEDLASRGYVVATVDHAYESAGTAFPGGRVLECLACTRVKESGETVESYRTVSDNRARDVSFLLDRLTGRSPAWRHAGLIDRGRIAMAGHSVGGAGTAAAMAGDRRIRAGVDMDGTLFTPVPEEGLGSRPFLLLGAGDTVPGREESWDRGWRRLDGWKRWITFDKADHFTFTDVPSIGDQTGAPPLKSQLSGDRSIQLTRSYVGAFFDRHLKGIPQPLLDGPSADAPEAVFHRP
ncbi:alpha/beta hydrolase family protein [Streptomyces sp. NPDC048603]|uniref:alpha/beta hydrolase family protein n=1 Tax=Streptomyces sp. NPDC048603 TaxID=3365577 RepID=UPI003714B6D1